MMYDRMQEMSRQEMERIHDAAMDLLKTTGVAFNDKEALEIFKDNGFKVEGTTVFLKNLRFKRPWKPHPNGSRSTPGTPKKMWRSVRTTLCFSLDTGLRLSWMPKATNARPPWKTMTISVNSSRLRPIST